MDYSSIDTQELAKFNQPKQNWWDENGEFAILQQINPIRVQYLLQLLSKYFPKQQVTSILDVGCGGGLVSIELLKNNLSVTSIDAVQSNIDQANQAAQIRNLPANFICTTIEDLPLQPQYQAILALEIIEHVHNPSEFISQLSKRLLPGGVLIISTLTKTWRSYMEAIIFAEYMLRWVKPGTHDWQKFIKPSHMASIAADSNLNLLELRGLNFDLAAQKWYISEQINSNFFAVFTNCLNGK